MISRRPLGGGPPPVFRQQFTGLELLGATTASASPAAAAKPPGRSLGMSTRPGTGAGGGGGGGGVPAPSYVVPVVPVAPLGAAARSYATSSVTPVGGPNGDAPSWLAANWKLVAGGAAAVGLVAFLAKR
jgi:hypothetical protein